MESIHNFDFCRLRFDENGNSTDPQPLEGLEDHLFSAGVTDVIFIAHGFRNSEDDATGLYSNFLGNFRNHISNVFQNSLGPRKFAVAAVYWPSKAFREVEEFTASTQCLDSETAQKEEVRQILEEMKVEQAAGGQKADLERAIALLGTVKDSADAQDEFVDRVRSLLHESESDPTEGLERICAAQGSNLLDKLAMPIVLPMVRPEGDDGGIPSVTPMDLSVADEGGATGIGSGFGSIFGRIGQFLNLTTWYVMKERAGTVGGEGVAKAIRDIKSAKQSIRIHLVGHSLGGRLMAACSRSLALAPKLQADSLTLLEAAFSHYGFSSDAGDGQAGFFRKVLDDEVVKGPMIATFSMQDTVVGKVYAIASRLAGDNVKAIGDANDPFGGIGRNGAQKTAEAVYHPLQSPGGQPLQFEIRKVVCLDGSGGLITNHSDVTNPAVTFAFASAVAQT